MCYNESEKNTLSDGGIMKKDRKLIIVSIIVIMIIVFIGYMLFKPEYYLLSVKTNKTLYDYADGILVKNFWKSSFYLNVNFDDPNDHCMVGLFIYEPENDNLKLLEAFSGSDTGECQAIMTTSGYSVTNKGFYRIEKSFHNGNIINQMLENKENTYLCISDYDIYRTTIEDCYKVEFKVK